MFRFMHIKIILLLLLLITVSPRIFALAEMSGETAKIVSAMEKAVDPDNKASKIRTYAIESKAEIKQAQIKMFFKTLFKRKNKMLSIVSIPGVMTVKQGFDGTTAWTSSPAMGVSLDSGDALLSTKFVAKMSAPDSKLKNLFSKITLAEKSVKVENVDCYKLICTIPEKYHMKPAVLYVDKKTLLTLKTELTVNSNEGEVTTPLLIKKYKKLHGIMWPEISELKVMNMMVTQTLKSVKINSKIPDSAFQPPKVENTATPQF